MTYKSAFRQVMLEYDQHRQDAEIQLANRRQEAYRLIPELMEIDKALAKIGSSLPGLALKGDYDGLASARTRADALRTSRANLLAGTLGATYLDNVYRCGQCQDTGYIHTNPHRPPMRCSCLNQRLVDLYYSLSNVEKILKEENFDTYDFRLFSTDIIPGEGLSPNNNMQHIYRLATKFVEDFDKEFANLLLYGATGLGKTFVCHCIAKDLLDRGRSVLYLTAPRLCKILEDQRFNRENIADAEEMLTAVDEVDLLILDDLGAEISTMVTSAALFDLINQRLLTRKHTVISTNLVPGALEAQYSERIVSRFFGNYQMIKFFGEDIRVKKKYGNLK